MATKFVTNLDINQNQLLNATFEKVATDPNSSNFEGRMIYNTTTDTIKVYTGSAWKSLPHTIVSGGGAGIAEALTVSESNGTVTLTLNVADTDSAGLLPASFWQMLNDATDAATASKLVKRDSNGNAKVATPTDPAHIATKGYVDAARQGLDVKQSVRVATTGPINLATDLEAGDILDTTVTLVAGNRVLVKDQGTASENGIYVVQASGAAVRASDANGTADTGEISGGTFTFVEEGTINADSGWVVSSNGLLTVGTSPMTWVQFSGAGQITAGDGLSKDGNILHVNDDDVTIYVDTNDDLAVKSSGTAGQVLRSMGSGTAQWGAVDLDDSDAVTGTLFIANGGTNASTEADARANLAAGGTQGVGVSAPVLTRKVALTIGDGLATSYTVTHGFGTRLVHIQVYDAATYDTVIADTVRTTTDAVTVAFASAPASNSYVVVVIG
jgi:hypothetical protein